MYIVPLITSTVFHFQLTPQSLPVTHKPTPAGRVVGIINLAFLQVFPLTPHRKTCPITTSLPTLAEQGLDGYYNKKNMQDHNKRSDCTSMIFEREFDSLNTNTMQHLIFDLYHWIVLYYWIGQLEVTDTETWSKGDSVKLALS